jgi:hypothetical protein
VCFLLGFSRTLAVAANNLDPVGLHGLLAIEFESNVLDQERPDFVAETVGI